MGRLFQFLIVLFLISFSLSESYALEDKNSHISEAIEIIRTNCRTYDCHYFKQNILRDTKICQPKKEIALSDPKLSKSKKITGYLLYQGVWPGKYSYTVAPSREWAGYDIIVKIHFKNINKFSRESVELLQHSMNQAAVMWTHHAPNGFFRFKFLMVPNAKEADFSVPLTSLSSRGPYYSEWSINWGFRTVAHEIGHMLGLDDEYGTILQHRYCSKYSLMCDDSSGLVKEYHYYQVLKRIHCK